MANLKELRRRIKSVKNTSQITRAMQMVAAAKMKKAQDRALKGMPYTNQLQKVLASLSDRIDHKLHPLLTQSKGEKTGVLVITTNKGLCGGINTNLLKFISQKYDKEKTIFYSIGKKGRIYLAKTGRKLQADFEVDDEPTIEDANAVSKMMTDDYLGDQIGKIEIAFPHFINTAIQKPTSVDLLPLSGLPNATETNSSEVDYEYEPDANAILAGILPHYISFTIFQLLLEAKASEHSSRMVAMKNATDNAKELIKGLTLQYNKARQAQITNQILEIASAAAAMNK